MFRVLRIVLGSVLLLAFAGIVGIQAYAGWHDALWPESFMKDDYPLRAIGGFGLGVICPIICIGISALFVWAVKNNKI
jgi:hypothetical protein